MLKRNCHVFMHSLYCDTICSSDIISSTSLPVETTRQFQEGKSGPFAVFMHNLTGYHANNDNIFKNFGILCLTFLYLKEYSDGHADSAMVIGSESELKLFFFLLYCIHFHSRGKNKNPFLLSLSRLDWPLIWWGGSLGEGKLKTLNYYTQRSTV